MLPVLNSVSGAFVGVYLAGTVFNGKLNELIKLLMQEIGYLEFLVALFVLYNLTINKWTSGPTWVFVALGVLSMLLYVTANYDFKSAFADFANGKTGLFDTLLAIARQFKVYNVETTEA